MLTGRSDNPLPSRSGLRSFAGFTCVSGDQYLQPPTTFLSAARVVSLIALPREYGSWFSTVRSRYAAKAIGAASVVTPSAPQMSFILRLRPTVSSTIESGLP